MHGHYLLKRKRILSYSTRIKFHQSLDLLFCCGVGTITPVCHVSSSVPSFVFCHSDVESTLSFDFFCLRRNISYISLVFQVEHVTRFRLLPW